MLFDKKKTISSLIKNTWWYWFLEQDIFFRLIIYHLLIDRWNWTCTIKWFLQVLANNSFVHDVLVHLSEYLIYKLHIDAACYYIGLISLNIFFQNTRAENHRDFETKIGMNNKIILLILLYQWLLYYVLAYQSWICIL